MAALTAARRATVQVGGSPIPTFDNRPVKAGVIIYAGAIVMLEAGFAAPGGTVPGLGIVALGRAEETVDNSASLSPVPRVRIRRGCFKWDNSTGSDAITVSNVGADCYVVDDHTVALTDQGGTLARAGKIVDVDGTGFVVVSIGLGLDL